MLNFARACCGGIVAALLIALSASAAENAVLWDMSPMGRFDQTNKLYPINDGRVAVDFGSPNSLCPTGLGGLAEERGNVREIVITYQAPAAGDAWFHVEWDPGGSGREQFEVVCNGQAVGKTDVIDAEAAPGKTIRSSFKLAQKAGANELVVPHLSGDGLNFHNLVLATFENFPRPLPLGDMPYPTLDSFSKAIGRPAVFIDRENVCMFAPKGREKAASVVMDYLVRAYEELYRIVGVHTKYKILVYAYPKGTPGVRGGTSGCVIKYNDENLQFENQDEWKFYHLPHVSGYIEEMAHNFVHATGAEFGWEMVGWSISAEVSEIVAPNPIHQQKVAETRRGQLETYQRYLALGQTFPPDVEPDQADRIHAYLLWQCEQRYGPNFWKDFFTEVRKQHDALFAPGAQGDAGPGFDKRYGITVDCFDRLPGLNFKKLLDDNGISTTVAVQSLKPTQPGWNRKLH